MNHNNQMVPEELHPANHNHIYFFARYDKSSRFLKYYILKVSLSCGSIDALPIKTLLNPGFLHYNPRQYYLWTLFCMWKLDSEPLGDWFEFVVGPPIMDLTAA